MTTLLGALVTYLVHSTALLAVAALADRIVRGEAWRDALWKTALVGAVLTTAVQISAGLAPVTGSVTLPSPTPPALEVVESPPPAPVVVEGEARLAPVATPAVTRAPDAPWTDRIPSIAVAAWALVAVVLVGRFLVPFVAVHRRLRTAAPPDPALQSLWEALGRGASAPSRGRLVVSDLFSTPAVTVGGTVVVPTRFSRDLAPDEQRAALAHELAHVARRDPEWRLVAGLVARVLLVQPLNLLAARRLRALAETLSDEWAVRHAAPADALARCLAAVAGWGRPTRLGAVGIAERPSSLHARVRRLLGAPTIPRPVSLTARLALGAVLLAAVTAAAPRADVGGGRVDLVPFVRGEGYGPVLVAPDSIPTLDGRWAWAERQLDRPGLDGAYVGYAIARARLHEREVFIADSRGFDPDDLGGPSPLAARLLGPEADRAADLVGLFMVPGDGAPNEVAVRTLSVLGDLGGRPVVWLGVVTPSESVGRWTLPARTWPAPLEARRVTALAVHPLPDRVLPLLDAVALSDAPDEVRVQAVEGYSYHADAAHRAAILARLDRVLATVPPEPVVHEAVRALARLEGEDATRRLHGLLRTGPVERRRQVARALEGVPPDLARLLLDDLLREQPPADLRQDAREVRRQLRPVETGAAESTSPLVPSATRQDSNDSEAEAPPLSVGYDYAAETAAGVVVWTTGTAGPPVTRQPNGFAFSAGQ